MNSIFYSVITLLLLTCGVLLLMRSANKNRYAEDVNAQRQPEMLRKVRISRSFLPKLTR